MNHFPIVKPLILSLPLLAFAACKSKNEFIQPPPPPVTVAHPSPRQVTTYKEAPATIAGLAEVEIRARVRGFLQERYFDEGEMVEEDEKLFLIEQEQYEAALKAADADKENADAALTLAQKRRDRLKNANENSKSGRAVSELDIEIAEAEVQQAAAVVKQMEAKVTDAQLNLDYTTIIAPTAGRMSRALVDVGNLVDGSQSTLLGHITDDSQVRVFFEVPERGMIHFLERRAEEGGVKSDQLRQVRLKLADGTLYEHPGEIDFVDSRVDPMTRTASIRAVFPNADGKLASGLFGLVGYPEVFPSPEFPDSVLVPAVSILRDLAGDYVWIVDDQNIVRRRGVETGRTVPSPSKGPNTVPKREMIVLKGLTKEDRVIVAGLQRAREGAPVDPQMEGEAKEPAPPSAPSKTPEN